MVPPYGGRCAWIELQLKKLNLQAITIMDDEVFPDIDVSSLPWLPLFVNSAFPSQPCIYFVMDSQSSVKYIGRTLDTFYRWGSHHRFDELIKIEGAKIAYLFLDEPKLVKAEAELIRRFEPPLNRVNPTGNPANQNQKELPFSSIPIQLKILFEHVDLTIAKAARKVSQSQAQGYKSAHKRFSKYFKAPPESLILFEKDMDSLGLELLIREKP
jgi:hypothetical protein